MRIADLLGPDTMTPQFQQAETYRHVASIAEENAVSINSNAKQEFMNSMQHNGGSMRDIEQTMVNHLEQAQAMADAFTHEKAQAFIQSFSHQAGSSQANVIQTDHENVQTLRDQQKQNDPALHYQSDHAYLANEA